MKILVFGNPLVEKDNLALKITPRLQENFPEIEFKEFDSTEDLENEMEDGKLRILDVVEGVDKVRIMDDIDKIEVDKVYSMHDFDLGYNQKLLKKIGRLERVEIICIPMGMGEEEALNQIQLILRKCVAQDIQGS
jgi:hypothetical protein